MMSSKKLSKKEIEVIKNKNLKQLNIWGEPEKLEKLNSSTQNVVDLRISPFMPVQKISKRGMTYKNFEQNNNILIRETAYGKIEIRNRLLTQHHSDIYHWILANKTKTKNLKGGKTAFYFSVYALAKGIGWSWGGYQEDALIESVKEISDVVIYRTDNEGNILPYKVIDKVAYSFKEDMWGIILDENYMAHFYSNVTINHLKRIGEIIGIEGEGSGLIKAIINFCITMSVKGGIYQISLDKLLNTVNYPMDTKSQRDSAVRYIRQYKDKLMSFNIEYNRETKTFAYTGTKDIRFVPALPYFTGQ